MSGYYDAYRGVVLDTMDPLDQRRMLVQVPDVLVDTSAWAVPEHGADAVPSVGDLVTVRFEQGDESYPIWSAQLVAPTDPAPASGYSGTYSAVVLDATDPGGYDRLLLQIPDVGLATAVWAMPFQPGSPLPAVGEAVWARFDGGDPAYPLWSA